MIEQNMLCWSCGTENDANNTFCRQCGEELHYLKSDQVDHDPNYKKNYFIERKDITLREFSVLESNQVKYKIQSKISILAIIIIIIFCIPVEPFLENLIVFVGQFEGRFSLLILTIFTMLLIFIVFIPYWGLLFLILMKTLGHTIIHDCLQDQTIGKGKFKDIRKKNWVVTGAKGTKRITMTFTTKTSGRLQCENGTYFFTNTETGQPEIDVIKDEKKIVRFKLGPEYKIRRKYVYYNRKEFQILSDETLQEYEMLFFASAIISKCQTRGKKSRDLI